MGLMPILPSNLRLYRRGDLGGAVEPLGEAAYLGPVGALVELVEPETEASGVALMAGLLTAYGAYLGSSVFLQQGRVRHRPNILVTLVGDTAEARKGTTNTEVRRLMAEVDADFVRQNFASGIASHEALVKRLADPEYDDKGEKLKFGTSDQRLVLMEAEFSRSLKNMDRPGSTLSEAYRLAYDGVPLENDAVGSGRHKSSNHCIGVFGGITPGELMTVAESPQATTGFFNRFLVVYAHSEKYLPDGGLDVDTRSLTKLLRAHSSEARGQLRLEMSGSAVEMWRSLYEPLRRAEDVPESLRPLLARRTDFVCRLALIYAVSMGKTGRDRIEVTPKHLEAGLAWVRYHTSALQAVLGGLVRDPLAGKILDSIRSHPGIPDSGRDLHALFGRNYTATQIEAAVKSLVDAGLAFPYEGEPGEAGGRPPQLLIATSPNFAEVADAA